MLIRGWLTRYMAWIMIWTAATSGRAADLAVLPQPSVTPPPHELMAAYLNDLARNALDARREVFEQLKTDAQIEAYQQRLRTFFIEQLDGFPAKTPLQARVVGRLAGEGFRAEKVIYESRPGFPVTAVLYLPLTSPPYPGVLVPCGHTTNGKAGDGYQLACMLLARNGMAALCYDPVGQGERSQFVALEGDDQFRGTLQHSLLGVGCILLGNNVATYRIWDGIRGIDYLVSRPDIDPQRIGCTGNSGGGTLTSYIMALDPRVVCAAPGCYLTSFERLLETIGPQDPEQNIHAQIAFGMNHADFLILRAPRPTLVCAATSDFFDIVGTWDTFRQAKRIYARLGYSERVDLVEGDHGHGFSSTLRVAMVHWMRRWLMNRDDTVVETEAKVFTEEELRCTRGGQVLLNEGVRSVQDLNNEMEATLAQRRARYWRETDRGKVLDAVRTVAGIRPYEQIPMPDVHNMDTLARDRSRLMKLILKPPDGIVLPALLFEPHQTQGDVYLYLHGDGKNVDARPGGRIENLTDAGHVVFAPDLRGIGETQARISKYDTYIGPNWVDYFRAYLLGRSYVGMRAEDILSCLRFLSVRYPGRDIHMIAIGEVGFPALHIAALEPERIASLRLEKCIKSWSDVVRAPMPRGQLINTIHGVLRTYDLPNLINLLPVGKVSVIEPLTLEVSHEDK